MLALAGTGSAIADRQGRLVVPGFNDAHWHFAALKDVELQEAGTFEELQKRLSTYSRQGSSRISWFCPRTFSTCIRRF
jgi:predicted amidohydrolase YtcJ